MKKHKTYCHICEEKKIEGMYVYNLFICRTCEEAIIQTDPHEEIYQYYVDKLKVLNQSQLYS